MTSSECPSCGGALRRSRRSFAEKLVYSEIHRCEKCRKRLKTSSFDLKHVRYVKCPRCHSVDLTVLKRRDGIDKMHAGFGNFLHKIAGGKLYHCWFCRLQFYDVRQRFNADQKPDNSAVPDVDSEDEIKIAS